jgi:hypothetical protein
MAKERIKIEDIQKQSVHKVPDDYFDRLPGIIQSRISKEKKDPVWIPVFRKSLVLAIPVVALFVIAYVGFFRQSPDNFGAEEILAQVETEDLVAYLASTDISTDELIAGIGDDLDLEDVGVNMIEDIEVESDDLDEILDDYDIELEYL